jgi:hypothetical protein
MAVMASSSLFALASCAEAMDVATIAWIFISPTVTTVLLLRFSHGFNPLLAKVVNSALNSGHKNF